MKLQATIWAAFIAAAAAFATGVPSARAQMTEPLRIGNTTPLQDVFGRTLDGKARPESARVEIFSVELKKPQKLLTNTVVGADAEPGYGYFSVTLPKRPEVGSTIRAVVYDAATSNDASFFCSARATVPASGRLLLDFGTPQRTSKFETDNDAWAYALNRLQSSGADSDEDGMSDYAEYLAGTDLTDAASLLAFASIHAESAMPVDGTRDIAVGEGEEGLFDVVLTWQAVPGITYRLQYAPSLLPEEGKKDVLWEDILNPFLCTEDDLVPSETAGVNFVRRRVTMRLESPFLQGHFRVLVDNSALESDP